MIQFLNIFLVFCALMLQIHLKGQVEIIRRDTCIQFLNDRVTRSNAIDYKKQISICLERGLHSQDSSLIGLAYHSLGYATYIDQPAEACTFFARAFDYRTATNNSTALEKMRSGYNAGYVANDNNQPLLARESLEKVVEVGYENIFLTRALQDLALWHSERGDYYLAEQYIANALSRHELLINEQIFNLYLDRAVIYKEKEGIENAQRILDESQLVLNEYLQSAQDSLNVARYYNMLGIACARLNLFEESERNYYKALEYATMSSDSADFFVNLGILYESENRIDDAIHNFNLANDINIANADFLSIANTFSVHGELLLKELRFDSALWYFENAFNAIQLHVRADSLLENQFHQKLGRTNGLITLIDIHKHIGMTFCEMSKDGPSDKFIQESLFQLAKADATIDLLMEIIPFDKGHYHWRSKAKELYQEAVPIALAADSIDLAHRWIERSRAIVLLESMNKVRALQSMPDRERKVLDDLQRNITDLETQIDLLKSMSEPIPLTLRDSLLSSLQLMEETMANIQDSLPEVFAPFVRSDVRTIEEIQKTLQDEQNVISLFAGRKRYYGALYTNSDVQILPLDSIHVINALVDSLLQVLTSYVRLSTASKEEIVLDKDRLGTILNTLYTALLQPFEGTAEELIIIPDEALSMLPFDILLTAPVTSELPYNKWPYVLNEASIGYDHSLGNWIRRREYKHPGGKDIHIFKPSFSGTGFPSLSQNDRMLTNLDLDGATVYTGSQANIKQFIDLNKPGLVHLLTHGIIHPEYPNLSHILMAGSSHELDTLFLSTMYQQYLPGTYVILQACQTNEGVILPGEGVSNMTRAFTFAGTSGMLTSQWPVNDQVSALLMNRFYKGLLKKAGPHEALRQAKLDFLKQSVSDRESHPYLWASLVAYGTNQPIDITAPSPLLYILFGSIIIVFIVLSLIIKSKYVNNRQSFN